MKFNPKKILCSKCNRPDNRASYFQSKETGKCVICSRVLYISEKREFQLNQAVIVNTSTKFVRELTKANCMPNEIRCKEIIELAVIEVVVMMVTETGDSKVAIKEHLNGIAKSMVKSLKRAVA